MKKQRKLALFRLLAVVAATVLLLATAALPSLAMGIGNSAGGMNGRNRSFIGRTADSIESGAESIADDLTDIPNGTGTDTSGITDNNNGTDGMGMNDEGILGDEMPEDGTNIPDTDIGGAVEDDDHDGLSDPVDSDDDGDGVSDAADTDADGDGVNDDDETTGVIGIVIAVVIVIAIIVLVIAVIPRSRRK